MTLEPTDQFVVQRDGAMKNVESQNLQASLEDTDLMVVARGTTPFKATGKEIKDSLAPADLPPTINSISLAGGPGFSDESYVTTLDAFEGIPAASKSMKARVTGELSIAGETSPITDVEDSNRFTNPAGFIDGNSGKGGAFTDITNQEVGSTWSDTDNFWMYSGGGTACSFNYTGVDKIKLYCCTNSANGSTTVSGDVVETSISIPTNSVTGPSAYVEVTPNKASGTVTITCDRTVYWYSIGGGGASGILLTLTDRTNLDNGAFVVNDVVTGYTGGTVDPSVGELLDDEWPQGTSEIYANMTWADFTADQSVEYGPVTGYQVFGSTVPVTLNYQSGTAREIYFWFGQNLNIGQTITVSGDVNNPGSQVITGDTNSNPSKVFIQLQAGVGSFTLTCSEANVYCYGRSAIGTPGDPPVTVVSISDAGADPATMTVSSGNWEAGQTVKNTVVNPITDVPESDEITDFAAGPNRPWVLSSIASSGYTLSDNDTTLTRIASQNGSISYVALDTVTIGPAETKTFTFTHTNGSLSGGVNDNPSPIFTTVVNKDPSDSADRGGYIDTKTVGWAMRLQDDKIVWYKGQELSQTAGVSYVTGNGNSNVFEITIARNGVSQSWTFINKTNGFTSSYSFDDTHSGDVYMAFTHNNYDQTVISGPGDSVLTLASSDGLGNFAPGYDVYQDSGYTAESSAITGVAENTFGTTWFTDGTAETDDPIGNAWNKAFNGTQTSLSDGIYGTGGDSPACTYTFSGSVTGTFVFDVYFGGGIGPTTVHLLFINGQEILATDSGWSAVTESSFQTFTYTGSINKIGLGNGGMYLNRVSLDGDYLVAGQAFTAGTTLSFEDATDLDVFEPGDVVTGYAQAGVIAAARTTGVNTIETFTTAWNSGTTNCFLDTTTAGDYLEFKVPSSGTLILYGGRSTSTDAEITATGDFTGGDRNFQWVSGDTAQTFQFTGAGVVRLTVTNSGAGIYVSSTTSTFNGSTFSLGTPVKVVSVGPGNQMTVDGGDWSPDDTVSCTYEAGTGTVASTSDSTMTLSSADNVYPKRWVAGKGKKVTGDATPIASRSVFLEFTDSTVNGTTAADPGFTPAPANLTLTFNDADNPSGRTWDQDFPAGTKIETQVRLTNSSAPNGVDSGWSNEVIARKLSTDLSEQELQQAYAETAASLLSHKNRGDYRTGQEAIEKRADLRIKMSDLGLTKDQIRGLGLE